MRYSALLCLMLTSLLLTACEGALDPYQRPGNWVMTGAARENTALQVANPSDLISGRSATTSNGVAASAAVDLALGGAKGTAAGLQTAPQSLTSTIGSGG